MGVFFGSLGSCLPWGVLLHSIHETGNILRTPIPDYHKLIILYTYDIFIKITFFIISIYFSNPFGFIRKSFSSGHFLMYIRRILPDNIFFSFQPRYFFSRNFIQNTNIFLSSNELFHPSSGCKVFQSSTQQQGVGGWTCGGLMPSH